MSAPTVAPFNEPRTPVPSDLEIAQEAPIEPILDIALRAGLTEDDLEPYGRYKAKVHLDVLGPPAGPARSASTSTSPRSRPPRWARARRR